MNEVFIEVHGEDGIFYDLVSADNVETHIRTLTADGYTAHAIPNHSVPDTIYRDFTSSETCCYEEQLTRNGTPADSLVFYHDCEEE